MTIRPTAANGPTKKIALSASGSARMSDLSGPSGVPPFYFRHPLTSGPMRSLMRGVPGDFQSVGPRDDRGEVCLKA